MLDIWDDLEFDITITEACKFQVRSGNRYESELHCHRGYELNYINFGLCVMEIEGSFISLCQGDCIIISPGVSHSFMMEFQRGCDITQLEYDMGLPQKIPASFQFLQGKHRFEQIRSCGMIRGTIENLYHSYHEKVQQACRKTFLELGFAQLYALFLTDPEFYGKLMEFARKRVYDYTDALLDSGVDALCVAGNVAGGFLGNNMFEQYILPYEKEYIAYCQRKGNPVIYHNCGRAMELIPAYKKMGAMNIEPFSPKPLGNTDLNELSSILNGEFSVTSGVDQVHVLQQGTVEEVERVTAETMEKGKKIKSFIMQNVDFLEYGTPMENVEAYARTALKIAKGE